jgi:FkbM family methyltransferase
MKVLFVDLGVHDGQEIEDVLRVIKGTNIEVDIYGIEANPQLHTLVSNKYRKNPNIKLFNICIGNETKKVKFFLANNPISSSIYRDKIYVTDKFVEVDMKKLSDFIKDIDGFDEYDVKILKANIEGAEYDMLQDLEENDSFVFDLYLGSGPEPYSLLKDMTKIPSIKDKMPDAENIMDRNNIVSHRFIGGSKQTGKKKNIDLVEKINELGKKDE